MAEENYKEYLAARVLTDYRPVTYRLLSRALKVNVNMAKHMLYEFHKNQNAKKPSSVHATYLLTGKKHTSGHSNGTSRKDGDDTVMRSSPFMSSLPEPEGDAEVPVPKTSIVLVRDEELERTKAEFQEITSIHVYSLEPSPIENLSVLSLCNQEIATEYANEDPLERWTLYGCIHNPYIKRRTTKYNPVPPKAPAKPTGKPTAAAAVTAAKEETAAPARRGSASEDNASGRSTPQPGPAAAKSTLKKADSFKSNARKDKTVGDLFKSFAKAKPKPKAAEKPKEADEPMQGMSEDEGDEDDKPEVKVDEAKAKAAAAREARQDREAELQKMMEGDIDMLDAEEPEPERESQDSTNAPSEKSAGVKTAESEPIDKVDGGRRRGRRRVTKRKKVQDADGYLVTKEETVWESFSEAEPEPKKIKPTPKATPSTAKGKKGAAKGQGSIASFFKKA